MLLSFTELLIWDVVLFVSTGSYVLSELNLIVSNLAVKCIHIQHVLF